MTTAEAATQSSVIEPARGPGPMRLVLADTLGFLANTLRLVWRHWPALLSLALAGIIGRELVNTAAVRATDYGGIVGFLVFLLAPIAMLIAMVLMLRTLRPSLRRLGDTPRPSVLNHLGSVLVPFLVFYLASGRFGEDAGRYSYSVMASFLFESTDNSWRHVSAGVAVAAIALVAFVVRWLLTRFEVVARRPWLGLPATYLETVWIGMAAVTLADVVPAGLAWVRQTRAGAATYDVWRSDLHALGPAAVPAGAVRDWLVSIWDSAIDVLVVPMSALTAGAVVLAANAAHLRQGADTRSRLRRLLRIGGAAGRPLYGRFASLGRALRQVFSAGVVPTMVYCLAFVAIDPLEGLLYEPERLLIGPRDVAGVWDLLFFPLQWFNQALVLVLLMCLIAAAVDRSSAAVDRSSAAVTSSHGQARVPGQFGVEGDADRDRTGVGGQKEVRRHRVR